MQAKEFVKRMDEVAAKLAALVKESDGEAAKYGQDIVLLAAFNNAQKYVSCNWKQRPTSDQKRPIWWCNVCFNFKLSTDM